jgi:hypothetical protein
MEGWKEEEGGERTCPRRSLHGWSDGGGERRREEDDRSFGWWS